MRLELNCFWIIVPTIHTERALFPILLMPIVLMRLELNCFGIIVPTIHTEKTLFPILLMPIVLMRLELNCFGIIVPTIHKTFFPILLMPVLRGVLRWEMFSFPKPILTEKTFFTFTVGTNVARFWAVVEHIPRIIIAFTVISPIWTIIIMIIATTFHTVSIVPTTLPFTPIGAMSIGTQST